MSAMGIAEERMKERMMASWDFEGSNRDYIGLALNGLPGAPKEKIRQVGILTGTAVGAIRVGASPHTSVMTIVLQVLLLGYYLKEEELREEEP